MREHCFSNHSFRIPSHTFCKHPPIPAPKHTRGWEKKHKGGNALHRSACKLSEATTSPVRDRHLQYK